MKGMKEAIARINEAIQRQDRIMVYGDYDVDGTSAVALVYSYLQELDPNIDFYIPDREREGYGISVQGVDYARETGVKLIIALDCGIKAVEMVDYAKQHGIDFIIGDHHLPGDEVPHAVAVLDPKQEDCPYPYKELSGCGIGFKIVEAHLEQRMGVRLCDLPEQLDHHRQQRQEELKLRLLKYLDLVAVSIASDIVPIMGENRVLAFFGLRVLNTKPRAGIEAILKYGHVDRRKADTSDQSEASDKTEKPKTGYFEKGKSALRPMTMAEIAEKTGIGESTVSRTVAGKWMRSPQGLASLRSFFTNAVKTADGAGAASSETVREHIRRLVAAEDPENPLSDQALASALKDLGFSVARRTVAKYREALRIPVAADRRSR